MIMIMILIMIMPVIVYAAVYVRVHDKCMRIAAAVEIDHGFKYSMRNFLELRDRYHSAVVCELAPMGPLHDHKRSQGCSHRCVHGLHSCMVPARTSQRIAKYNAPG